MTAQENLSSGSGQFRQKKNKISGWFSKNFGSGEWVAAVGQQIQQSKQDRAQFRAKAKADRPKYAPVSAHRGGSRGAKTTADVEAYNAQRGIFQN